MCLYYLVSPEVAHSLLLPEATTLLSHSGAYSWPDAAIVTCGPRQQGFGLEVPAKPGTDGHTIYTKPTFLAGQELLDYF